MSEWNIGQLTATTDTNPADLLEVECGTQAVNFQLTANHFGIGSAWMGPRQLISGQSTATAVTNPPEVLYTTAGGVSHVPVVAIYSSLGGSSIEHKANFGMHTWPSGTVSVSFYYTGTVAGGSSATVDLDVELGVVKHQKGGTRSSDMITSTASTAGNARVRISLPGPVTTGILQRYDFGLWTYSTGGSNSFPTQAGTFYMKETTRGSYTGTLHLWGVEVNVA